MTSPFSPFRPARWLPGPHAQTFWSQLTRSRRLVEIEREALPTPDGDEVILDSVGPRDGTPQLIICHGLEGSTFSPYAQSMLSHALRCGWRGTVLNFRSCARRLDDRKTWIPNRRPRLYHSGETTDFDHVVNTLHGRRPNVPIVAVGVSLGGNMLLKWLAEHPEQSAVAAAATLSVPYDLRAAATHLKSPLGRLYVRHFLTTLKDKLRHAHARFPEAREKLDLERALGARDIDEYDDAATAPLHGFDGADDYYVRASSIGFVDRITTPTLCISAADDPFLPATVLDRLRDVAAATVEVVITSQGGHVGFVAGRSPLRPVYWAEEQVLSRLVAQVR